MSQHSSRPARSRQWFDSSHASLCLLGGYLRRTGFFRGLEEQVPLPQKVRKYTPSQKLEMVFVSLLAGAKSVYHSGTTLRVDPALQAAFGLPGCADQSVISKTLNQCHAQTVDQMRQAMSEILRTRAQSTRHDYSKQCLLVDIDMSGMPAGRRGEEVSKGYFAGQKNRRGRQLGRVIATLYDEILVDRLYEGKRQLDRSLPELIQAAAEVLNLTEPQRSRTILRVDAGGGTDPDINLMLKTGYQVLVKIKSWKRAYKLAQSVSVWYPDPKLAGREVGWVASPFAYARTTRQMALRTRKKNGQWSYHVLVFTLSDDQLVWLARHQGDPRQPWKVEKIDKFPTSHHIAWADLDGDGKKELINAPPTRAASRAWA